MPRVHKGNYYFPSYDDARTFARLAKLPADRIICYRLGWAIQRERSGPYYGPTGWR